MSEGEAEAALLHHHFQHLLAEDSAEDVRVQPADGLKSAVLSPPTSLRHQAVQVGVIVELVGREAQMANRRLPMRKIKEILRLHFQARLSARSPWLLGFPCYSG